MPLALARCRVVWQEHLLPTVVSYGRRYLADPTSCLSLVPSGALQDSAEVRDRPFCRSHQRVRPSPAALTMITADPEAGMEEGSADFTSLVPGWLT